MAPACRRAVKGECGPYAELAKLCGQADTEAGELAAWAASRREEWEADGNLGLVQMVVEGQAKRHVLRLTQTYLTLRWVWAGWAPGGLV